MKKNIAVLLLLIFSFSLNAQKHKKKGFLFDSKTYSFGDVEQWHNQAAIFTFTNKTNHLVSILPLFNENDLDVLVPKRPIKIGESVVIKAYYYTDGLGAINRKFPIYFGSMAEPIYLRITGNIKSLSKSAYIACPMSKPESGKARVDLIGDIAEIDTEIPLSGTVIEIVGLNNNKNITLYSSSTGKFITKLSVGNYQIKVSHPNYFSYTGPFYIGQTSPPLSIRLTPIVENPVFAHNDIPNEEFKEPEEETPTKREKETYDDLNSKNGDLKTSKKKNKDPQKVENVHNTSNNKAENDNDRTVKLERDNIDSDKEPKDNPFSKEENDETSDKDVPATLTTYKESIEPKKDVENKKKVKNKVTDLEDKTSKKPKKKEIEKVSKEKQPKEPKEKVVIPVYNYTFRVIDRKSSEPIYDAIIYVHDVYNKNNKHKEKTDEKGYTELELTKNDYRYIASADGYISNELRIEVNHESEIFKIMLTPVSDLFNEIYEAKKAKQAEDEEVLERFSFGKTEFTFAKDEPTTSQSTKEPELVALNNDKDRIEKELEQEKLQRAKENEKALQKKISDLELRNKEKELELARIEKLENENAKRKEEESLDLYKKQLALENDAKSKELDRINDLLSEQKDENEKRKLDSLNIYIDNLLAKNKGLENDLNKTNSEKEDLVSKGNRDKELIDELNAKNNEQNNSLDDFGLSKTKYAANNILFLIDVSTSMAKSKKMEMLQKSIKNLARVLRDIDRVAIIAYNQKSTIVLESVAGNKTNEIVNAIDSLKTGGLTNGVRGLNAAYEMLEYYYVPNGNNQIILATDGLFSKNNNEMTEFELNRLVKKQSDKNLKLTVVGFGKNEDGKDLMTKLARNGTGQYIQIKNDYMTKDVLIREIKLNSEKK